MEAQSRGPAGFDLSLLRRGEVTVTVGAAIVLIGLVVMPWYLAQHPQLEASGFPGGTAPAEFGAWSGASSLATLANLVILAAALGAIAVTLAGARGIELDGSGSRLFLVSVASVVAVLARIVFRPTAISGYRFDAGLRFGIFLTLAGTLIILWGAVMRAQRTVPARAAFSLRAVRPSRVSGPPRDAGSRSYPRRSG